MDGIDISIQSRFKNGTGETDLYIFYWNTHSVKTYKHLHKLKKKD